VTPWIHPSVDPELNTVFWSFGNVRSCGSSQDGQQRPGDNLFGNSLVAVDAKTGQYKWHFQAIRHDISDMDNVSPTVLGDIQVGGQTKKAIYYGSKSSLTFILDRTTGQPITAVNEVAIPTDSRQQQPVGMTQKIPAIGNWQTRASCYRSWARTTSPAARGGPCRTTTAIRPMRTAICLHRAELSGRRQAIHDDPAGYLSPTDDQRPLARVACTTRNSTSPCCRPTTQNGGNDFSGQAFVQHRNIYVIPYGYANVAHYRSAGQNGLRAPESIKGAVSWR
jgi:hypothetical protein